MKKSYTFIIYAIFCLQLFSLTGCKKAFLDKKPSSNIVEPKTLNDMALLLEYPDIIYSTPALPILSSDEYEYIDHTVWQSLRTATERNTHVWAEDLYSGSLEDWVDWSLPYKAIFYANLVLNGIDKADISKENPDRVKFIKGWAHFVRAYSFYNLASNFCNSYDRQTAATDLGLPLKLQPNIDVLEQRSTLEQTYKQILSDLNDSKVLLQNSPTPSAIKNHPSLAAVYGLEARISLNMRNYINAYAAADKSLALYDDLIDYNTINLATEWPFMINNRETLYTTTTGYSAPSSIVSSYNGWIKISESLLDLYDSNDLRRKIYFTEGNGGYILNGNYAGEGNLYAYTGLATDEMYLIKSECAARAGDFQESMQVINALLIKRYKLSDFQPRTANTAQQALEISLLERRKELVWRGLRWEDLKRLNKEGANITLTRNLNGKTYTLPPNDPRYIFPIPLSEILASGITQNKR